MSLAHAILGVLHKEPMSGYDLKTRWFDDRVSHFWPADQAQVYRTLERMRHDGWVAYDLEVQEERPNRKVYRLTAAGRAELARWLGTERPDLPPVRDPFLVQLFFSDQLPDEEIRDALEHQRGLHEARLLAYEAVPLPPLTTRGVPRDVRLMRMTLERGLAAERAALEWIDACLGALGATGKPRGRAKAARGRKE